MAKQRKRAKPLSTVQTAQHEWRYRTGRIVAATKLLETACLEIGLAVPGDLPMIKNALLMANDAWAKKCGVAVGRKLPNPFYDKEHKDE